MTIHAGAVRLALAAALATVLAAAGLQPIIGEGSWATPALLAVGLVAVLGIGLRALRVPAWAVLVTQGVALVLWVGSLVAGDVARLGFLPSREWAARLAETFSLGVDSVASYQAPVPLDDGILLLVVGGVGLTAWSVDALAVTARMAPLAGVPLAIMHAVAMSTTPDGPTTWAFVAVAAGYLLLLVVDGRERARVWGRSLGSAASATSGTRATSLSAIGVPMAACAVGLAVLGASAMPEGGLRLFDGAGDSGGSGGQTIRTDNPIVDLRRDLVQPENVEVIRFTTTASTPEYLRLLTLDVYDGSVWRTSDRPVPEDNRVSAGLPNPPGLSPQVEREQEQYALQISENLQSQWLPLPYPVSDVRPASGDWRYDSDTLDVVATDRDTRGLRYDVTALTVAPTPDQLGGLPPLPGQFLELLELPDDLPPVVRDLAREVTAESADSYERAVALQSWFRTDGGFVYDLSVDPGNGSDDLVAFLDERRGYCEQYAATMAIMARSLGIPARVAVGYLGGEETQPGSWVIRAQDAHAWPELYFDGIGWVRFEPTPGSRTGPAPSYTVADATSAQEESPLDEPVDASSDSSDPNAAAPLDDLVQEGALGGSEPNPWPVVAAVGVVLLLAVAPWLTGVVVRRRRWAVVGADPRRAAEAAWADVQDAALEVGLAPARHTTIRVAARDLGDSAELAHDDRARLGSVAQATEQARFARVPPDTAQLRHDAESVRHALVRRETRPRRWLAAAWPAPARRLVRRMSGEPPAR